jgi:hypothetical protein
MFTYTQTRNLTYVTYVISDSGRDRNYWFTKECMNVWRNKPRQIRLWKIGRR